MFQDILPWLSSAMTLWAVWLAGQNLRLSWKISLANQSLWLAFIVASGAWGLLPLTLALAAMFARHLSRPPKSTLEMSLGRPGCEERPVSLLVP